MLVHHSHYARNITTPSLVELLKRQTGEACYPVHRLDHKTSGLILMARSVQEVSAFQELFASEHLRKYYRALLRGFAPDEGVIDSPVKNDRGNYREALTEFRTIQRFELDYPVPPYATARYSLVEFTLHTGRKHQLRIHANKISHPIIGDPKHGNRHHNHFFSQQLELPDLFLHAERLEFRHPFTSDEVSVTAPFPDFWQRYFRIAEEHAVS